MTGTHLIIAGIAVLLAVGAVGLTAKLSAQARAAFVYAQLALITGVYVGFAVVALDKAAFIGRSELSLMMIEGVLALTIIFAGLVALMSSKPWLLGVLILFHGAVDVAHLVMGTGHVPAQYAFACVIYDAIVGGAAIYLLSEKRPQTEG